ncbi:MAG: undecaprenyl-diphosphate phosphatase [Nitrospirae bacterium]|nr:MAG: undecaprenyl-diphosphate phosphatase [Nitrospirota bacterium]
MWEAVILGMVQGLTEFFPVSSTAHLILFPWFFGWTGLVDTLTFDVALHAGTLLALLVCFWRDWWELCTRKFRLFGLIILASVPAGVAGILLNKLVEHTLRTPSVIAASLVLAGFVMLASERIFKHRTIDQMNAVDALLIGLAQAVALIPGVSRSGITMSAGMFRGLEREAAVRFSFLLSTPIIAGATLLHARKMISGQADYNIPLFAAGFIASAITGYAAIRFLMYFLKKHPLNLFVYYRFLLAGVILAGMWFKG